MPKTKPPLKGPFGLVENRVLRAHAPNPSKPALKGPFGLADVSVAAQAITALVAQLSAAAAQVMSGAVILEFTTPLGPFQLKVTKPPAMRRTKR